MYSSADREGVNSPNIIRFTKSRRMEMAGHIARMGERRGTYRVLVEEPEGKQPLGRPRCRLEDIIKWIFTERYGDMICSCTSGW
jgi:hypothetical protein